MARKRQLADGIMRLPDGRLEVRPTVVLPDGRRRNTKKILPKGTTLAEADEWRRRKIEEWLGVYTEENALPTLGAYSKSWLRRRVHRIRNTTAVQYAILLEKHVIPVLGHLPVDEIDRRDLLNWRTDLERIANNSKRSLRTVRNWWKLALAVIRNARADYQLSDITIALEAPQGRVVRHREQDTLSLEEAKSLIKATWGTRSQYRMMVVLLTATGMRRGEGIGLRWEDIDYSECIATINQSVTYENGIWEVNPPKNGNPRKVGLVPEVIDKLQAWRREMLSTQHPGLSTGLVCPSVRGEYAPHRSVRSALDRATELAGIEQQVTPQVLRRTFNTLARFNPNVDPVTVKGIIGHVDDAMSLHYLGLRNEQVRETMARIWNGS